MYLEVIADFGDSAAISINDTVTLWGLQCFVSLQGHIRTYSHLFQPQETHIKHPS